MFSNEEHLVAEEFNKHFGFQAQLLFRILDHLREIIESIRAETSQYGKYAVAVLAAINLKGFISAIDRLEKGYLNDSEAILKKNIESFLAQAYFEHNPEIAKDWCQSKIKIKNLEGDRFKLAKVLDKINNENHFFPTDMDNFFEEYVYGVGYKNSNMVAHLDFELVHAEIGLDTKDLSKLATTLVIGPKFEETFMKITLNRLIMFAMFQLTYLKIATNYQDSLKHNELGKEVKRLFM